MSWLEQTSTMTMEAAPRRRVAVAFAALVGLGALAGSPAPARAQGAGLSDVDRVFLVKEARGAAHELQSAKLAVQKATRRDVKDYAEKLVQDHIKYNAALEKLGKDEGLTLPTDPDAPDKARMVDLERLSGKAFDELYLKEASRINADDERDGDREKASTKSRAIEDFLAAFDAMDKEHAKLARKLETAGG